jgi:monovalent cation:H+ antiporter, CPA1 family
MSPFELVAALLVLTAGLSYLNHRLLRLPTTIGVMALTLLASAAVVAVGKFLPGVEQPAREFVHRLDFSRALLHGMLGFLLFAGSLHIDLGDLARRKLSITLLATLGVLLSTLLVGGLTWCVLAALGLPGRLLYCLLFGALISPTDPIAVLALLKQLGAPKTLEIEVAGESLFNDGIGVAVFLGLLEVAAGGHEFDAGRLAGLFVREAVGGVAFGLAAGLLAYLLLKSVDDYRVEVLLSLALVAGGYALAERLHLSGPSATRAAAWPCHRPPWSTWTCSGSWSMRCSTRCCSCCWGWKCWR